MGFSYEEQPYPPTIKQYPSISIQTSPPNNQSPNDTLRRDLSISTVQNIAKIFYKRVHSNLHNRRSPLISELFINTIPGVPGRCQKRTWCRDLLKLNYCTSSLFLSYRISLSILDTLKLKFLSLNASITHAYCKLTVKCVLITKV